MKNIFEVILYKKIKNKNKNMKNLEKNFSAKKIKISDIEKISEKKSLWVSKKFSLLIFFWVIFFLVIWFLWFENFSQTSANILNPEIWENLHWSADLIKNISSENLDYLKRIYYFLWILFFAIYILYIFAKMELQKFWEQWSDQKNFATKNFPSIYILETMTMLYVIVFLVLSFYLIQQIDFQNAFKTLNSSFQTVANFALFWWSLSSLFFFLHKVRPWKFVEWEELPDKKVDFDVNRVLKYLAFPFMSAWMWVVSYLIVMWIWDIFWIESLKDLSEYFMILLATMAWYFCDAFVIFFHSIFKGIESNIQKKISK